MYALLVFLLTILVVTIVGIRFRPPPFFTLVGGALFFGLITGMPFELLVKEAASGLGKVFSVLGVVILGGAVIAKTLQDQHYIEVIVSDIRRVIKQPYALAGTVGYLLAIPLMCCITAFVILEPIISHLGGNPEKRNGLLYTAALGSLISFALVYPTPVIVSLFAAFPSVPLTPTFFSVFAIPISLVLLSGTILLMRRSFGAPETGGETSVMNSTHFHPRAWYSFLVMLLILLAGLLILHLSSSNLIQVVMLAGMVAVLLLAPASIRREAFSKGTKHAGMIIFDLCGAGALGSVIGASNLTPQAFSLLSSVVPVVLVPFLLAALIQTAQGSRVVTVVITGEILAGSTIVTQIGPLPLFLMISGGACILSYMTDPYFWLVQRATGDDIPTVVRNYTVPLAAFGVLLLTVSLVLAFLTV